MDRFGSFSGAVLPCRVRGIGGASTQVSIATPSITGISPSGTAPGGQITITGTNLTGANTTVLFSGAMTGQTTASSGGTTSIVATVPTALNISGTYNVTVVGNDGIGDGSSPSNAYQITIF